MTLPAPPPRPLDDFRAFQSPPSSPDLSFPPPPAAPSSDTQFSNALVPPAAVRIEDAEKNNAAPQRAPGPRLKPTFSVDDDDDAHDDDETDGAPPKREDSQVTAKPADASSVTGGEHNKNEEEEEAAAAKAERLLVEEELAQFEPESLQEQMENMREHFFDASARYDRMHTINQGLQLVPGQELYMRNSAARRRRHAHYFYQHQLGGGGGGDSISPSPAPVGPSGRQQHSSAATPTPGQANESTTPDGTVVAPAPSADVSPARSFAESKNYHYVTPTPARSTSSRSHDQNSYGPSPLRNQTFSVESRSQFDIWLQQEMAFTHLCFYAVESASRARMEQQHRQVFDWAVEHTTKLKLLELEGAEEAARHEELRCQYWCGWMELVAMQEMVALVLERWEWLVRTEAVRLYLHLWPDFVQRAQEIVDEEESDWVPLMDLHRNEEKRIRTGPLSRFWIASEATLVKEKQQEEWKLQRDLRQSAACADDGTASARMSSSLVTLSPAEVEEAQAAEAAAMALAEEQQEPDPNFDYTKYENSSPHSPLAVKSSFAEAHHSLRAFRNPADIEATYGRDQVRISLQNRRQELLLAEAVARRRIAAERHTQSLAMWTDIFPQHESISRAVTADLLLRDLVRVRQRCEAEQPFSEIVSAEQRMRRRWEVVENLTWKEVIEPAEAAQWQRLLDGDRLRHRFLACALARQGRQALLRQSAHVIKLFVVQRRQVQRVINMRRNVAKFMQRCGRGYLTRLQACRDRLFMLKCRADALYRLRCRISMLAGASQLRARFARGEGAMRDRAFLLCRWMQWRRSCLFVRWQHNRMLAPHAAVFLALAAAKFSELLTLHLRRCRASAVLRRAMAAHRARQHTRRIVAAKQVLLSSVLGEISHRELLERSATLVQRFGRDALESLAKAKAVALRLLRASLVAQRVGRGALSRRYETRPAHLFTVQEQLFGHRAIATWWRRLQARRGAQARIRQLQLQQSGTFVKPDRAETASSQEALLDAEVPRIAATMLGAWWRMTAQRRRYCAWRISAFFVRHRLRTQLNFMKDISSSSSSSGIASDPVVAMRTLRRQERKKLAALEMKHRRRREAAVGSGSRVFVIGSGDDAEEEDHDGELSALQQLSNISPVRSISRGHDVSEEEAEEEASTGAVFVVGEEETAEDSNRLRSSTAADVEIDALNSMSQIIEEAAVVLHALKLHARVSWLDALSAQQAREQRNFLRGEAAVRSRLERHRVQWRVAMLRLIEAGGGRNYFFIPFEFDEAEDAEDEVGYPGIALDASSNNEKQQVRFSFLNKGNTASGTGSSSSSSRKNPDADLSNTVLLNSEKTHLRKRRRRYVDALSPEEQEALLAGEIASRRQEQLADNSGVRKITAGEQWHRENQELEDWKIEQHIQRLKAQVVDEVERSKAELNPSLSKGQQLSALEQQRGDLPQYVLDHFGLPGANPGTVAADGTVNGSEGETQQQGEQLDTSVVSAVSSSSSLCSTSSAVVASVSDRLRERRRSSGVIVAVDPLTGEISTRTVLLPSDLDFEVKQRLEELQNTIELQRMRKAIEMRRASSRGGGSAAGGSTAASGTSSPVRKSSSSLSFFDPPERYELFKPSSSPQSRGVGHERALAAARAGLHRRPLSALTLRHKGSGDPLSNGQEPDEEDDKLLPPKEWLLKRRRTKGEKNTIGEHQNQQQQQQQGRRPVSASLPTAAGSGARSRFVPTAALDPDQMIQHEIESHRPFDKNIAARAPQPEYAAVTNPDFISPRRLRANFSASSAAKQADRRRLLSDVQDHRLLEQCRPELLRPPVGRHFETLPVGRFDVCRWWGSRIGPSTAASPRVSLFGSASLAELCEELSQTKPIEVLGMASPWFPLNGGAIAAIIDAAVTLNKKNMQQVFVSNEEDQKLVLRLLRREGMEKVKVVAEE